jgi:hypothetical protein
MWPTPSEVSLPIGFCEGYSGGEKSLGVCLDGMGMYKFRQWGIRI